MFSRSATKIPEPTIINNKFGSNEFNVGFELSESNYISDRVENGKQIISNNSLFGQLDIFLFNCINAVIGTRFDRYDSDRSVISPRIGIMYDIDRWKIRIGVDQSPVTHNAFQFCAELS